MPRPRQHKKPGSGMRRYLFLLIVGLVGLGVLLSLGTWQIRRLSWKTSLLAEIDRRIATTPSALPAAPDPVSDKYLPVSLRGQFLPGELDVLVSYKQIGPGYRIVAPFDTGERLVLVDRGFVPTGARDADRDPGPVTVAGNLHWPDETDGFTPEPDRKAGIWFARDVEKMAAELGTEPVLVVAASETDAGIRPMPVTTAGIPNDHLQYAMTWFGLAAVWAGMTGFFLWRTRTKPES